MNRSRAGKWVRRVMWASLLAIAAIGCNPLQLAGFIFARPDKVPAAHPLTFDKDGPKKDKEEVVVVLLPQVAPGSNDPRFASTANELADRMAKQLPELAKENKDKRKVKVVSQTQVDKFKVKHPNWKQMSPGEIGQKLGADFVLEIHLTKMRLYRPDSVNSIYEGRAEVFVGVHEVGADGGGMTDQYTHNFSYPKGMAQSADSIPESAFKAKFIENLAADLARQHVDHTPSDSIADGR